MVDVIKRLGEVNEDRSDRLAFINRLRLVPVMHDVDHSVRGRATFQRSILVGIQLSSILFSIYTPTNDSSNLLKVAVSEIGRRSVSVS